MKITEVAQIFGLLFTTVKFLQKLDKNVLGYILGDFLTSSPGHLGSIPRIRTTSVF
jgi:hypothetical protein